MNQEVMGEKRFGTRGKRLILLVVLALFAGVVAFISVRIAQGPIGAVIVTQRAAARETESRALNPAMYYKKLDEDLVFVVAAYHSRMGKLAVPYFVFRTDEGWETVDSDAHSINLMGDPNPSRTHPLTPLDSSVKKIGNYTIIWIGSYIKKVGIGHIHDSMGTELYLVSAETIRKAETGWGGWGTLVHYTGQPAWETPMDLTASFGFFVVKDMPKDYVLTLGEKSFTYDYLTNRISTVHES